MTNRLNYVLFGLINQPQIWVKGRETASFINYLLLGIVNQPQFKFEQKGGDMDTDVIPAEKKGENVQVHVQGGNSGAVYGLGLIGAAIYYISRAETPQEKAIGFLKACVWPVFLVKEALEYLHRD